MTAAHRPLAYLALPLALGTTSILAHAATQLPATGNLTAVFAPEENPQAVLQDLIADARHSIAVQAYVFTSKPLADALIAAHRRGVQVRILLDARMNRRGNAALQRLLDAHIPLSAQTAFAAAHDKVMILDPQPGQLCAVATGSYNYTWSAQHRNAENLLVLRQNCPLAARYAENWQTRAREATPIRAFPLPAN